MAKKANLPAELLDLPDIGKRIRDLHAGAVSAYETALDYAHDAGSLLQQAKLRVPHGEWDTWVNQNCRVEKRTEQIYRRVFIHWDEIQQKRTTSAPLSINAACKLIATPKPSPVEAVEDESEPEPDDPIDVDSEPVDDGKCPECQSEDFHDDGSCQACRWPNTIMPATPQEPVCEPHGDDVDSEPESEQEAPESATSWLQRNLRGLLRQWREEYPAAEKCFAGVAWENAMHDLD